MSQEPISGRELRQKIISCGVWLNTQRNQNTHGLFNQQPYSPDFSPSSYKLAEIPVEVEFYDQEEKDLKKSDSRIKSVWNEMVVM